MPTDTTPPELRTSTATQTGTNGYAGLGADLVLRFSEAIALGNSGSITLRRSDTDQVVETFSIASGSSAGVVAGGSTVSINPQHDLDYATGYYLTISPGAIRDTAGNSYAGVANDPHLAFRTVDDPAAPILSQLSFSQPGTGAGTDVALDTDIVLDFSASVHLNSGSLTLRRADTRAVVETFNVLGGVGAGVSAGGSSVTINPSHDLDYATDYYLTVEGEAIRNSNNNAYISQDNTTLSFRTSSDAIAPTLNQTTFSSLGSDGRAKRDADIVLAFDEAVRLGSTGSIVLHRAADNTVVEALSVTGGAVQVQSGTVMINPSHDLDYATNYYLTVDAGAIRDAAGNPYADIILDPNLAFRTTAAPVTTGGSDSQPSDPRSTLVDGVSVSTSTQTQPDGRPARVITVWVVTDGRTNTDPSSTAADIPLVSGPDGSAHLTARVPVGFGLKAIGTTAGAGPEGLIQAIQARTDAGSAGQGFLTGNGRAFLNVLPPSTSLLVQTIVPTVAPGTRTAPAGPLVIEGLPSSQGGEQQSIVLDANGLPPGSTVELHDIDFAAILGAVRVQAGSNAPAPATGDGTEQAALAAAPDPLRAFGDGAAQTIVGGLADDSLFGGAGNDVLQGGLGDDLLLGNQDADLLMGNRGRDALFGGQGDDTLFGGQDNDRLTGDIGSDLQFGNLGNDTLFGNQGADTLFGGQGADTLYGGQGDDVLSGDLGDDVLSGDLGADRYVFGADSGRDLILGFSQSQGDRIDLQGQTYRVETSASGNTLLTLSGGGTVELSGVTRMAFGDGTGYFG
ncbi:Ig-like domain-containing protein [Methylobacterium sp. A54F]